MGHKYKLTSRKLWVTIAELLLLILNAWLDGPLDPLEIKGTIAASVGYVFTEGIADIARYKNGGK